MAEYVSRDKFVEALMQEFDVVVDDVFYDSLASLEIDEFDFDEFIYSKFGEERCNGVYDKFMNLNDVYSNLF